MLKAILSGYEGSKKIIPASSYLWNKHTKDFGIYYLNYGEYTGKLFTGKYIQLRKQQESKECWSKDIVGFLETLKDQYIIFGLDDFLLNSFREDLTIKLSSSTNLHTEYNTNDKSYSCTAQLTLWNRCMLIEILKLVNTPWDFELSGSKYINSLALVVEHQPIFDYCGESALSSRHPGMVSVKGLDDDTISELLEKKLLNKNELIIGQPIGDAKKYE